jgi:uncharacterized membrane protein
MEEFAILLLVGLAAGLFVSSVVLPILAWKRSQRIVHLEWRLERAEADLRQLRRELRTPPQLPKPVVAELPEALPTAEAVSAPGAGEAARPPQALPAIRPVRQKRPVPSLGEDAALIEAWLGRHGLGWGASLLLIFAVAFFLKYAFDNEWIGPTGQVAAGVVVASGLCLGGLHYHRRGWRIFSQILSASGVALLYLATYSTFGYFHLLPQAAGSYFLVLVVVGAAALALKYRAQAIGVMAVVGGLLTPVLMHTDIDHYTGFFTYLLVINAGAVVLTIVRPWPWPAVLALVGTQLLFWMWHGEHYHPEKLAAVLAFQSALFLLHLGSCTLANLLARKTSLLDLLRLVLNGVLVAVAAYFLLDLDYHVWMGTLAIGFATIHALAAWVVQRRRPAVVRLSFVMISMALAFAAAAVPLQAHAAWIPVGWAAQGLALWWFGLRIRTEVLRSMGAALLVLALLRLVFVDTPYGTRDPFVPFFNSYGLAATVTAACLVGAAYTARQWRGRLGEIDEAAALAAGLASIALIWLIASVETYGYFSACDAYAIATDHTLRSARTALSICWAVYAVILLAVGFWMHSDPIRWSALAVFFVTVLKVIFLDMADLPGLYRVLAFLVLAVMMGASAWAYQRFGRHRPELVQEVHDHVS